MAAVAVEAPQNSVHQSKNSHAATFRHKLKRAVAAVVGISFRGFDGERRVDPARAGGLRSERRVLARIPVRLPLRKRVRAAGLASFVGNTPREIPIFPIHGHAEKIRRRWKPEDLGISPPS